MMRRPPETAEASSAKPTWCMPLCMMGCRMPNISVVGSLCEPPDSTPAKQHCTVVRAVFDLGDCGSLLRSVNDFEQAGRAHAAADAHRDDAILRPAPPALDQDVAGKSRPRHPIRVAH